MNKCDRGDLDVRADPDAMTEARPRHSLWYWIASFVLAAVLLDVTLRGVDWRRIWQTIVGARWGYLAGFVAMALISYFLRSLRWRILLNAEADLRVLPVFWATMAGYFGNSFLPARAGELVRTFLISRRSSLTSAFVLTTALSERLMDAIALVLCSSLVLLQVEPKPRWIGDVSRTLAVAAGAGALGLMLLPYAAGLWKNLIDRAPLPRRIKGGILRLSGEVLLGVRAFHHIGRFFGFTALTAAIWLLDAFSATVGARGLGLRFSLPLAMLLLAGLGLASSLPSTPGYLGINQFVAVSVLMPFGIGKDGALAYIFVAQALNSLICLVFGLPGLYLARGRSWRLGGSSYRKSNTEGVG